MCPLLNHPSLGLVAASARLEALRRRARQTLVSCPGIGAIAALVWIGNARGLAISLIAGALAALIIGALSLEERRGLLLVLVAAGDADSIPDVAARAGHLAKPAERRRLAGRLRAAADRRRASLVWPIVVDPGRAVDRAPQLRTLADTLVDQRCSVTPYAIAICWQLITDATSSPLYNPRYSERDLDRVWAMIERGITAPATPTADAAAAQTPR